MSLIPRKKEELQLMKRSGQITALALRTVINHVKTGVSLIELDQLAEGIILKHGGQPSFKTVPGYKWTTCLTVNSEVVHGIPRDIKLAQGNKLSIDLGTAYKGWHTDAAWSVIVGHKSGLIQWKAKERFLEVGEKALWQAINYAIDGNKIGDISAAIQETIENKNYTVVKSLIGHGIGKALHEEPEIPGYGRKSTGFTLKEGMTLAIEAIYNEGGDAVILADDGWTIKTADGSLGGLFEMTVVVGKKKAEVLTDWRSI